MAAVTRGLVGVAVEAAHAGEPSLFKLLTWAQDSGAKAVAAAEAKLGKVGGDDEIVFKRGAVVSWPAAIVASIATVGSVFGTLPECAGWS